MSYHPLGTPIKCDFCNFQTKIRLKRGVYTRNLSCPQCKRQNAMRRNTTYDQERRGLKK
jgi:hypothetical protein